MYISKSNKHYPFSQNEMDICTMPKPLERCLCTIITLFRQQVLKEWLKERKKRGTAKDRSNNIQLTLQRIYVKFLTILLPFPPSTSKLHRTFPYYFPNSFLSHCLMTPFPLRSLEDTGSPKEEWGLSQSSATLKKWLCSPPPSVPPPWCWGGSSSGVLRAGCSFLAARRCSGWTDRWTPCNDHWQVDERDLSELGFVRWWARTQIIKSIRSKLYKVIWHRTE